MSKQSLRRGGKDGQGRLLQALLCLLMTGSNHWRKVKKTPSQSQHRRGEGLQLLYSPPTPSFKVVEITFLMLFIFYSSRLCPERRKSLIPFKVSQKSGSERREGWTRSHYAQAFPQVTLLNKVLKSSLLLS